ncbi:hypothetical protein BJX61DRAFT_546147 [Aspergillus egyptiacus]|nr:hypothetical protein BJX61DRAFT_546147 [Aspergillus egyptiacus]
MAEAFGIVAGVCSIIDTAANLIRYINSASNADKEAIQFASEASLLLPLMLRLQLRLKDPRSPLGSQAHTVLRDVVFQLRDELLRLTKRLFPEDGSKATTALKRKLLWPVIADDIRRSIQKIERLKTFVGLVLDDNLTQLANEIKADTQYLKPLKVSVEEIATKLQAMKAKMDTDFDDSASRALRERQDTVVRFMAPWDFSTRYQTLIADRLGNTGRWFLDSEPFQKWSEGHVGVLWCPGMPGAGKSILAAAAIEHMERKLAGENNQALLWTFCEYQQGAEQTKLNMLGSLWRQLLRYRLLRAQELLDLENKYLGPRMRPTAPAMYDLLQREIDKYDRTYIFIDGLDELSSRNRDEVIGALGSLCGVKKPGGRPPSLATGPPSLGVPNNKNKNNGNASRPRLQLLVTARFSGRETDGFEQVQHLDVQADESDLHNYIQSSVRSSGANRLSRLIVKDPTLLGDIQSAVVQKASGMFLLAKLHLKSLADALTIKATRKALKKLPEGDGAIARTYEDAMARIDSQNSHERELAQRVISWVLCSHRPLTLRDMQFALTVDPDDEDDDFDRDDLVPEALLISACAGLVIQDRQTLALRFVHYTAQEYFESLRTSRFSLADSDMARTSLSYLMADQHALGPTTLTIEEFDDFLHRTPFFAYAARFWGVHARVLLAVSKDAPEKSEWPRLEERLEAFFDRHAQLCCAVRGLLAQLIKDAGGFGTGKAMGHAIRTYHASVKALNICAFFGLNPVILSHLARDPEGACISNDGFLGNVIHWAVLGGCEDTLHMLLQRGDCQRLVNEMTLCREIDELLPFKARSGHSPLHLAAYQERPVAVKALINHGADPGLQNHQSFTPIHVAAHSGSIGSIKAILSTEQGRHTWLIANQFGGNSMVDAAIWGHTEVVKLLLASLEQLSEYSTVQTIPGLHDWTGRNPLHYAAERGFPDIVRILLDSRFGYELALVEDDRGSLPLHQAAFHGYVEVTKTFFQWVHADIFLRPPILKHALRLAAGHGHSGVLQILLELAPNYAREPIDAAGCVALHYAARSGNIEAVQVCVRKLDRPADVDRPGEDNLTALMEAARTGHAEVIEYLVSVGANPNAVNSRGDTALHLAIEQNLGTVVELLLSLKADVQAENHQGLTPVGMAVRDKGVLSTLRMNSGGVSNFITQSGGEGTAPPGIQASSSSSSPRSYVPTKCEDQLHAAFVIKVASQRRLPAAIIGYIFDLAEYWLRHKVQVVRPMLIDERTVFAVQYARTPPISGYGGWPVRQLIFSASSYEENIRIPHSPQPSGSSSSSSSSSSHHRAYTWWEAAKVEENTAGQDSGEAVGPIFQTGPICFWNVHMGPLEAQTHTCTWPVHGHMLSEYGDEVAAPGRGEPVVFYWCQNTSPGGCLRWMRELRPGMRVALIPKASFSNKVNHVSRAEITMCTSFLRR